MESSLTCNEVKTLLFELRRDELTDLQKTNVDKHLRNCPACRELAEKTEQMFDAAADADPLLWADIDADLLFDRTEENIVEGRDPVDEQRRLDEVFDVAAEANPVDSDDIDAEALFDDIADRIFDDAEPTDSPPPRGRTISIALAAAACAALLGWWIFAVDATSTSEEPTDSTAPIADSSPPTADSDPAAAHRIPPLRSVSSPWESLQIFVDDAVNYAFSTSSDGDEIELVDGALLVEVRPDSPKSFSVQAQAHTVTVTGTVFTVETGEDAPRIAVFEGSVDVTDPREQTYQLKAGEYFRGGKRGQIDAANYSAIEDYVDLETHRALFRQATADALEAGKPHVQRAVEAAASDADRLPVTPPPAEEKPSVAPPAAVDPEPTREDDAPADDVDAPEVEKEEIPDEPVQRSSSDLYEKALTALHDGQPQQAAHRLEEALELTERSERLRADILLELARIHLRDLDDPEQAADYLDRFVTKWPDDPAADAIRHQLCKLGVDETGCP